MTQSRSGGIHASSLFATDQIAILQLTTYSDTWPARRPLFYLVILPPLLPSTFLFTRVLLMSCHLTSVHLAAQIWGAARHANHDKIFPSHTFHSILFPTLIGQLDSLPSYFYCYLAYISASGFCLTIYWLPPKCQTPTSPHVLDTYYNTRALMPSVRGPPPSPSRNVCVALYPVLWDATYMFTGPFDLPSCQGLSWRTE